MDSKNNKEGKIEYLQMIQEPICRMSTSSAIFKGFTATIVAGASTVSYYEISTIILALSFVPVLLFAILDIYYLQLEKRYRYLYETVRLGQHEIDFSMELIKDRKLAKARVIDCLKSPSVWIFYPAMVVVLLVVLILKENGAV